MDADERLHARVLGSDKVTVYDLHITELKHADYADAAGKPATASLVSCRRAAETPFRLCLFSRRDGRSDSLSRFLGLFVRLDDLAR